MPLQLNVVALELLLLPAILLLAFLRPTLASHSFHQLETRLRRLAAQPRLAIPALALATVALRLALLPLLPVPVPQIHDEFSHLLAADTFAHARLLNPPPPLLAPFESFHILVSPHYFSMEPPLHGLALAAGQLLTTSPWAGVLLEAALLSVSASWLLYGWLPPLWALSAAAFLSLRYGVFSYWTNSYWGGALAAAGGALVLGAYPRLLKNPTALHGLALGLGAALLAGTRPYEGAVVCLVAGTALAAQSYRRGLFKKLILRAAPPAAALLLAALTLNALYNLHTTGSPSRMPHQLNRELYAVMPYWVWQPLRPTPSYNNPEFLSFYTGFETLFAVRAFRNPLTFAIMHTARKGLGFLLFCLPPLLCLPYFLHLFKTRRPFVLALYSAFFFALACSTAGFLPHYAAPLLAITTALAFRGLRLLRLWRRPTRTGLAFARWSLAAMALVSLTPIAWPGGFVYLPGPEALRTPTEIARAYPDWASPFGGDNPDRRAILEQLSSAPPSLVLVRYTQSHNVLDEWVYNPAHLPTAHTLFARELSPAAACQTIAAFPTRTPYLLTVSTGHPTLAPYPSNCPK